MFWCNSAENEFAKSWVVYICAKKEDPRECVRKRECGRGCESGSKSVGREREKESGNSENDTQ